MQFSQNIDGFRQNKKGRLEFSLQLYKQNPSEKFFISTILPKLYIGFKV